MVVSREALGDLPLSFGTHRESSVEQVGNEPLTASVQLSAIRTKPKRAEEMNDTLLNPKQVLAATAIAMGESHRQAAKVAKVIPGTISEWMQDPEFKAAINQIQLDIMNEARDRFRGLALSSIAALEDILKSSKNERMRLDAAKYILSTIDLTPCEGAFWMVGPTTAEEVESKEHIQAMRARLQEIQDELKGPVC